MDPILDALIHKAESGSKMAVDQMAQHLSTQLGELIDLVIYRHAKGAELIMAVKDPIDDYLKIRQIFK